MSRRPWTPDRPSASGGTTITVKRCCNGCGEQLGDVSDADLAAAISGAPLPDVRDECSRCSRSSTGTPDLVQCQGCGAIRDASWLDKGHACWRNEDGTYEEGGTFQ